MYRLLFNCHIFHVTVRYVGSRKLVRITFGKNSLALNIECQSIKANDTVTH